MAKGKSWLTRSEENALLAIGKRAGLIAVELRFSMRTLTTLERKGLVSLRHRDPEAAQAGDAVGWFLTSDGFFLWKQLKAGKSFHPQKPNRRKKGGPT
jgi:hypothetical protein